MDKEQAKRVARIMMFAEDECRYCAADLLIRFRKEFGEEVEGLDEAIIEVWQGWDTSDFAKTTPWGWRG